MKTVTFFGDWHGNTEYAINALEWSDRWSRKVHVGDFGFWPGSDGRYFLEDVNGALEDLETPLYVVPGNHENWPELRLGSEEYEFTHYEDGFMVSTEYPMIRVVDRVNVWDWDGVTFAALAGANSIDYQHRKIGRSWWPEESPTVDHVNRLADLAAGRDVNVLVTHDAPSSAIEKMGLYPAHRVTGWSDEALEYAAKSAHVVELARARLNPDIQYCGHHHVSRCAFVGGVRENATRVQILGDDSGPYEFNRANLAISPGLL